jgi:anti-sigma B factor antagonist
MEVSANDMGEVTVVAIRGNVDGLTADQLMEHFTAHVAAGKVRLVADCAGLDYTSSAGLRTLLGTVKAARQKGGDLRLAAVRPPVLKVLQLSGFTSILKSYDDVPAAVASYAA